MPIRHKFENCDFHNGFSTQNGILHTPYKPEVIFIGTFNHGWAWNPADFFYGRGMYMWPILGNIFLHNNNGVFVMRRNNNVNPSTIEIFEICNKAKITFADIVLGTANHIPVVVNAATKEVHVNNDFTWKGYKDEPLDDMGAWGWLDDNVNNIVGYINERPSIKHVYFTFKSGVWLVDKMNLIIQGIHPRSACSIFTPTGNGFGRNLQAPYHTSVVTI